MITETAAPTQVAFDLDRLIDDRAREGWFSVHRDAFRDPAVFDLEMRHIFEATWNFVGLESQLEKPNDCIPTMLDIYCV